MAIITAKSTEDYALALKHLLPPGEYFSGADTDKITLSQADELARIHAKIDRDFNINTGDDILGWKLSDYRQILTNAGLTDFQVFDQCRLPFVAGSRCGAVLGDNLNISMIVIIYLKSQKQLFLDVIAQLKSHKLTATRILAMHSDPLTCGATPAGTKNFTLIV